MNSRYCSTWSFRSTVLKWVLGLAVPIFLFSGPMTSTHAQAPSFTFNATIPDEVEEGATFTVPASITNVGGEAINYNSYFQIYDIDFNYQDQTYFTNQTFAPGQTLNYDVTLTAPSTPGSYFVAGLIFDENYVNGIISQQFFLPTFTVVPASAVPEPSSGFAIGLLCVGVLALKVRLQSQRRRRS